jgi:hypothetical protein
MLRVIVPPIRKGICRFILLILKLNPVNYYYYLIYKMLYYSSGKLNINNHNPQI